MRGNELFPLFFSMTETTLTKVRDWLEEKFTTEEAFHECYLVDLTLSGNKLAVFVDTDTGVSLYMCQQISRFLEERIEAQGLLPEKYVLEVSSPGTDRPLSGARQYRKHIGRTLKVHVLDPENEESRVILQGKLTAVDEQGIRIEYEEVRREGKKKIKENVIRDIPFSEIDKSFVLISFK